MQGRGSSTKSPAGPGHVPLAQLSGAHMESAAIIEAGQEEAVSVLGPSAKRIHHQPRVGSGLSNARDAFHGYTSGSQQPPIVASPSPRAQLAVASEPRPTSVSMAREVAHPPPTTFYDVNALGDPGQTTTATPAAPGPSTSRALTDAAEQHHHAIEQVDARRFARPSSNSRHPPRRPRTLVLDAVSSNTLRPEQDVIAEMDDDQLRETIGLANQPHGETMATATSTTHRPLYDSMISPAPSSILPPYRERHESAAPPRFSHHVSQYPPPTRASTLTQYPPLTAALPVYSEYDGETDASSSTAGPTAYVGDEKQRPASFSSSSNPPPPVPQPQTRHRSRTHAPSAFPQQPPAAVATNSDAPPPSRAPPTRPARPGDADTSGASVKTMDIEASSLKSGKSAGNQSIALGMLRVPSRSSLWRWQAISASPTDVPPLPPLQQQNSAAPVPPPRHSSSLAAAAAAALKNKSGKSSKVNESQARSEDSSPVTGTSRPAPSTSTSAAVVATSHPLSQSAAAAAAPRESRKDSLRGRHYRPPDLDLELASPRTGFNASGNASSPGYSIPTPPITNKASPSSPSFQSSNSKTTINGASSPTTVHHVALPPHPFASSQPPTPTKNFVTGAPHSPVSSSADSHGQRESRNKGKAREIAPPDSPNTPASTSTLRGGKDHTTSPLLAAPVLVSNRTQGASSSSAPLPSAAPAPPKALVAPFLFVSPASSPRGSRRMTPIPSVPESEKSGEGEADASASSASSGRRMKKGKKTGRRGLCSLLPCSRFDDDEEHEHMNGNGSGTPDPPGMLVKKLFKWGFCEYNHSGVAMRSPMILMFPFQYQFSTVCPLVWLVGAMYICMSTPQPSNYPTESFASITTTSPNDGSVVPDSHRASRVAHSHASHSHSHPGPKADRGHAHSQGARVRDSDEDSLTRMMRKRELKWAVRCLVAFAVFCVILSIALGLYLSFGLCFKKGVPCRSLSASFAFSATSLFFLWPYFTHSTGARDPWES
ncbi:hypothetical protein DL93DRAFT_1623170 [Clavulina sp. PMI_390]|nr:hypothetical protein DL93DRAFT_1623170 [Clavulina sp. PMI_390]